MISNSLTPFNFHRLIPQTPGLNGGEIKQQHHNHRPEGERGHHQDIKSAPQKGITRQFVNALEKALQADGLTLQGLDHNDFTPEKVADRILSFIGQALGRSIEADPGTDESEMLGQIKKGVERAFKETRKMLKELGIFKGEIKEQVEQTQQLVEKGLDRLKNPRHHANAPVMQFQGVAMEKSVSQSTALEIRTQEGDLVKIDFSQSYLSSSRAYELQGEGFYSSGFQSSSAMNYSLNIVVDGGLNEDEIKAIDGLMQKMNKVSHAFYEGKLQAAFKKAQHLGFDMQQLSGFSLDLSMQQNVQAVAVYQQVNQIGRDEAVNDETANQDSIRQATDFLADTRQMFKGTASLLNEFASPRGAFIDLFTSIGKSLAEIPADIEMDDDNQLLDDLVIQLADSAVVDSDPMIN